MSAYSAVFGRMTVRGDDDFFGLGGNPVTAARIAAQLSSRLGYEVDAALVEGCPSPARLALRLYRFSPPVDDCLVLPSTAAERGPNLFYMHSTSGTAMVARSIDRRLPVRVVGIRAAGMNGECSIPGSIEELARVYASQIVKFQPAGPYHLAGFSAGGLLAFEVASQLREREAEPGLVILVDTELPGRPTGRPATAESELLRIRRTEIEAQFGADASDEFIAMQLRVHARVAVAARAYRPSFYPGRVDVITAELSGAAASEWRSVAAGVAVHDIGGKHIEHEFMVDERVLAVFRSLLADHCEGEV